MSPLSRTVGTIATALLLALGPSASWSATTAADDAVESQALAESLLAVTPLLPAHALIAELKRLAADPAYPLRTRERALAEYALGLRASAPDPVAWGALEFLSAYRERWLLPHPEAGAYRVSEFHVAATARGTLNLWLRVSARNETERDLAAGEIGFLDRPGGLGHRQRTAGIIEALEAADRGQLERVRAALKRRYPGRGELAPIALAVGRLSADETLIERVVRNAPALRFRTVYELDRHLGAERAEQRWREWAASADDELAGAAIAALAAKGTPGEDLFALLAARLSDPGVGVAAAHALGRARHPSGIPRLAAMLKSADRLVATRAALALKLDGSPAALAALRLSTLDEVRQWRP